jgi:RES domain-containing protein
LTITSWRVVTRRFRETAFDGEGARIVGGRWNSIGTAVVYTAATSSLGLLEMLVRSSGTRLLPFYLAIPVIFDERNVYRFDRAQLPKGWSLHPSPRDTQKIGDEWVASMQSWVLEVPSVIVPHESNFILNPKHPDFGSLEIGEPVNLEIDPRLV